MQGQFEQTQSRLEMARALVTSLESNDILEAERLISELSEMKKDDLFLEVGRLTRELHDAINGFLLDERISDMTSVDIPDAKERLNYVITMTQQAADRTLNDVEESLPIVEEIGSKSEALLERWKKLQAGILNKSDFKELSDDLAAFLEQMQQNSVLLRDNLSDVLMAQDFQDLTGQIIRKVINLVHSVEEKLVMLVRITGGKMEDRSVVHKDPGHLEGPAVPNVEQGDQMTNQDDVDDLLSSLGF